MLILSALFFTPVRYASSNLSDGELFLVRRLFAFPSFLCKTLVYLLMSWGGESLFCFVEDFWISFPNVGVFYESFVEYSYIS